MLDKEFNHVVSLGGHCETKYQIIRLFGKKGYPFDWWVTPTGALVEILENDFYGLFEDDKMRVIFDGDCVACMRYGTAHFHDFRDAHPTGKYDQELVTAGCAANREKFAALANRFRSLSGRVLFIRIDDGHVSNGREGDFTDELAGRMLGALDRMLPNASYDVLLLRGDYRGTDPRIHYDTIEKDADSGWAGSDRRWDEMIARQRIRYAAHVPALS